MGKYNKLEVKGMDELLTQLKKMHDAPEKVGRKALQEAGKHVKDVEVSVAKEEHPRMPEGYSQDVGWKELKKYGVRTRRQGSQYVDIGLRGKVTASQKKKDAKNKESGKKRPTQWDRIKGLWFNNFGFYHNRTGEYIAGSNWIGKAYDESSEKAYRIIKEEIVKGMGL